MQYTWTFGPLKIQMVSGDLTDVVTTVDWCRTCTDGAYSASNYGQIACAPPNPAEFVDFNDLTAQQVQAWVENILGANAIAACDADLAQQINDQRYPITKTINVPW